MQMTAKEMFLGCFVTLAAVFLALYVLAWGYFAWAAHQRDTYLAHWTAELQTYDPQKPLPEKWQRDVCLRKLPGGEWVVAAIYHGGCAPGRYGEFNAMVLRDSRGKITTYRNSPCAGGIDDLSNYWEYLVPAKSLDELYRNQQTFAQR